MLSAVHDSIMCIPILSSDQVHEQMDAQCIQIISQHASVRKLNKKKEEVHKVVISLPPFCRRFHYDLPEVSHHGWATFLLPLRKI